MGDKLSAVNLDELEEVLEKLGSRNASAKDIPNALVQLSSIREATEGAAGLVMDAADQMGAIAEKADIELSATLMDVSINLYEATSFQDLCGQRLTKIERLLSELEQNLTLLADKIGDEEIKESQDEVQFDEHGFAINAENLLNGPQLDGEGQSQDDIDALMASVD